MEFQSINEWGFVKPGTKVSDSKGSQYVVGKKNDKDFICLRNISGGESEAFDSMDPVDHNKYTVME